MPERTPPLSRQIAADLSALIRAGELAPGAILPSERELVERYRTSKSTASKAVALLQAEGLVSTEFGRGTFVRSRPPLRRVSAARRHAEHRSSGKPIFDTEAIEQGQVPSRQILETGRAALPPDAARWLHADPGSEAVIRRRLQLLDGIPAVLSTSYYPLWMAAGTRLESPGALPEGPDELIENLGHHFSRGIEVFRARMPSQQEVRLLRLSGGVPVVQMWNVDYDQTGRPLQAAEDLYAADRHEFAYEWSEGDTRP
jgi:GntR family transcriptional regulator